MGADHFSAPLQMPDHDDEDAFGFGGGLDEDDGDAPGPTGQSSSAGGTVEPPLTQQQVEEIQRNRAMAAARRAAHAPPATPSRKTTAADPARSRSAHGGTAATHLPIAVKLPPLPLLPTLDACAQASPEPLRDLNLFLQRRRMEPARFDVCMEDATHGLWHCQASAGGVSARGTGHGKAAAKREAAKDQRSPKGSPLTGHAILELVAALNVVLRNVL